MLLRPSRDPTLSSATRAPAPAPNRRQLARWPANHSAAPATSADGRNVRPAAVRNSRASGICASTDPLPAPSRTHSVSKPQRASTIEPTSPRSESSTRSSVVASSHTAGKRSEYAISDTAPMSCSNPANSARSAFKQREIRAPTRTTPPPSPACASIPRASSLSARGSASRRSLSARTTSRAAAWCSHPIA